MPDQKITPALYLFISVFMLIGASILFSQTVTDLNEGSQVEWDETNQIYRFKWWGKSDRTYFIQHSEDLVNWSWVPIVESGGDVVEEWGFTSTGNKFFLRLAYSDQPTSDPEGGDFDNDGISNLAEVTQNTDPLADLDVDLNGLSDHWEHFHGFGSSNPTDAATDTDGDGLTNLEEQQTGTDPNLTDTDGDTVNDSEDGWPLSDQLAPARLAEPSFAVIAIAGITANRTVETLEINNQGQVLLSEENQDDSGGGGKFFSGGQVSNLPDYSQQNNSTGEIYYRYRGLTEDSYFLKSVYLAGGGSGIDPANAEFEVYHQGVQVGSADLSDAFVGKSLIYIEDFADVGRIYPGGMVAGHRVVSLAGSLPPSHSGWGISNLGWSISNQQLQFTSPEADYYSYDLHTFPAIEVNAQEIGAARQRAYYDTTSNVGYTTGSAGGTFNALGQAGWNDPISINNANMVLSAGGSPEVVTLWKDAKAGIRNDMPLDAQPSYVQFDWDIAWGASPPTNLNAQMRGFNSAQFWQNGAWLDIESLVPATQGTTPQWSNIEIRDMNDHGSCVATATNDQGQEYAVLLLPVEVESLDKMVHGSIQVPESWDDLELSFKTSDGSQDLGTFDLSDTGNTYIYESLDDIFNEAEVNAIRSGSTQPGQIDQNVVFVKDENDPDKIHFYTAFNSIGEIKVGIHLGGNEVGSITHELEEQQSMALLLDKSDDRISTLEIPVPLDPPVDWDRDGNYDSGPADNNDTSMLIAAQPGTLDNPGVTLDESLETDPNNLVLLINDDSDDVVGQADNADTSIGISDDDMATLTLQRPLDVTDNTGTMTVSLSDGSAARLYNAAGDALLVDSSVNLASPIGDLAGLAAGEIQLYLEGMSTASNVTVTLTYDDGQGNVQSDTVHFNVSTQRMAFLMQPETHIVEHNGRKIEYLRYYTAAGVQNIPMHQLAAIGDVENRNFLAKTLIPAWETIKGTSQTLVGVPAVAIDFVAPFVQGAIEGAWDGANDDAAALASLPHIIGSAAGFMNTQASAFVDDPAGRGGEITNATLELLKHVNFETAGQMKTTTGVIIGNMIDSVAVTSEKSVTWDFVNLSGADDPAVFYGTGYVAGYVGEQVYLLGAATKIAGNSLKGVYAYAKGSEVGLTVIANLSKFRAKTLRFAAPYARSKKDFRKIRSMANRLAQQPVGNGTAGQIIVGKLDELGDGQATLKTICDDIAKYGDDAGTYPHLQNDFDWNNHGFRAMVRLAELIEILGDQTSHQAIRGFVKNYGRIIDSKTTDNFDEFVGMFDTSTPAGKIELKAFLEDSVAILDDPASIPGAGSFPGNRGFAGTPQTKSVPQGKILSRYGSNNGEFLADDGIPLWARSLPDGTSPSSLKRYEVLQAFDASTGRTAPWFGKSGGGIQYDLGVNNTVQDLIDANIIREL